MGKRVLIDVARTKKSAKANANGFRRKGWNVEITPLRRKILGARWALYYTGKKKRT